MKARWRRVWRALRWLGGLVCWVSMAPAFSQQVSLEQVQAWLAEGRYAEMDAAFDALQRQFQRQPEADDWLVNSFSRFSDLTQAPAQIEPALDAWVSALPRSYAGRTARGVYYAGKGMRARWQRETRVPGRRVQAMRHWFDFARRDLLAALDLNPMPLVSHAWLMTLALNTGEHEDLWRYFRAASAYAPASQTLHYNAMLSLMPSWGGSLEAMERFATERERVVGPGLTTNTLWGTVWYERVAPLMEKGDFAQADRLLSRALAKYGSRRLYCARARARVELDRWDDAMQDMMAAAQGMTQHDYCARVAVYMAGKGAERPDMEKMLAGVIAANPENVDLRRYRGWLRSRRGDHADAYDDLLFAARSGDAWAQSMVARYHLKGLAHTPVDPDRAVELFRASARKGDMHAQQSLTQVLKALGRQEEADLEARRYRVSEAAHPRVTPAERAGVSGTGAWRHLLDPRVQAVLMAALLMLWIQQRARRR